MPRRAQPSDVPQLLVNLLLSENPPREDEESLRGRLFDVPNTVAVIDEDSKADMWGIVYLDEPGVKVIHWGGPPEAHFRDLMAALGGFVKEVMTQYPMSRPWRFYGDTPSEVLANRWVAEVKEPGGRDIVVVRTSPNNFHQFEGESTIGEVARALGVRGG